MKISLLSIVNVIGSENCENIGDLDVEIVKASPLGEANKGDISFCKYNDKKGIDLITRSKAEAIICPVGLIDYFSTRETTSTLLFVENPRLTFFRVVKRFFYHDEVPLGIHHSAFIGQGCTIGENTSIGRNTIIGNNVAIGHNTRIFGNVIIKDNVTIGSNVTIYENCLIGQSGFSFERNEKGILEYLPNIGRVVIENDVEIFPFTNVDRGTLSTTYIRRGTKIDHYCHIGHNVEIGSDCVICAGVILAGGVKIGESCFLGVNSAIKNKVTIGNNVTVGMGSVVVKDISDSQTIYGVPANPRDNKER